MMRQITRRNFLKGTAAGAASLAFSTLIYQGPLGVIMAAEETSEGAAFAETFKNIDATGIGGMLRWWIPGDNVDLNELSREVYALADAGFTGVEVVRHKVYDGGNGDGWMSDAWVEASITIMEAARECGMQVDFMMTGGNLSIPLDDPSATDATDRQVVHEETEVVLEAGYDGSAVSVTVGIPDATDTVYVGKMISISAAKVTSVEDSVVTLDATSIITNYSAFDENDTRFSKSEERFDSYTEEDLTVEISFPANDTEEFVTYKVFAIWEAPTGGTFGNMYYIDHLSPEGAQAILDYYDAAIEKYPEFGELLSEVGGSLFGDSLELTNSGEWSYTMLEEFYNAYGYDCAPYLISLFNEVSAGGFGGPAMDTEESYAYDFGDGVGESFRNAYYKVVTKLYIQNHVKVFDDWAQQYGMHYRGQSTYGYYAYNAEASLDIPITETESLHYDDYTTSYRWQSGSAHVGNGTGIYSSEVGEIMNRGFMQTWQEELWHMNRLFVSGVNQIIHHGFAYATNLEDDTETWPGYLGMFSCGNDLKTFFPSFDYLNDYNDYTTRASYLLRQGAADIDLAVFYYRWEEGDNYDDLYPDGGLIDSIGFNYDIVEPAFFDLEDAVVENGELFPETASYKAIIFNNQESMPLKTAEKLVEYADAGLPLVFVGALPSKVGEYTGDSDSYAEAQAEFEAFISELSGKEKVIVVDDYANVPETLSDLGIVADASYEQSKIMTTHRTDEGVDFYFVANQTAVPDDQKWQSNEGAAADITFRGEGKPYELNLWTGDITPIAKYTVNEDGSITFYVELEAKDTRVFAIATDDWYQKEVAGTYVVSGDGEYLYDENGSLLLRATENATYTTVTADGTETESTVSDLRDEEVLTAWHLQFINYEPAEDEETYWNVNKVVAYDEDIEGVQSYNTLEDLEGCDTMSGVGIYTTTIAWDSSNADGAYLALGKLCDLYSLYVNDELISGANPLNTTVDIGSYLTDGDNTIRVEVASNLYNAVVGVRGYEAPMPSGFGGGTFKMLPDELTDRKFGFLSDVKLLRFRNI
ncbi:MAG: twin-arginine translocation signal domain-containing protein [Lachnospiraceae bacterium]|nr:twin-arginine translocation signal domain-containing protein [Lachnospiraceae bacterium]